MNCPVPKFDCKKTPDPLESDSACEVNLLRFSSLESLLVTDMPVHPGLYHMSDSHKCKPGMTAKEPRRRREDGICYTNTKMPKKSFIQNPYVPNLYYLPNNTSNEYIVKRVF